MYQPGFSRMFRWITAGTCVVEYPRPMKFRHTSFCEIICRNTASASCSLEAAGSASGFAARMPAGIVAWMSASSVGYPRTASMARTSASEGPTWRGTNVSGAGSGVTARLLE